MNHKKNLFQHQKRKSPYVPGNLPHLILSLKWEMNGLPSLFRHIFHFITAHRVISFLLICTRIVAVLV